MLVSGRWCHHHLPKIGLRSARVLRQRRGLLSPPGNNGGVLNWPKVPALLPLLSHVSPAPPTAFFVAATYFCLVAVKLQDGVLRKDVFDRFYVKRQKSFAI